MAKSCCGFFICHEWPWNHNSNLVSNLVWFLISREKSRCVDVSHCFTMFYCCHLQPIVSAQNNSIRMLADAGGLTQSPPNIQDVRRQKMSIGRCFEAFFNIFQCQLRLIRPFLRNGGSPAAERWGRGGIVGPWVGWCSCWKTVKLGKLKWLHWDFTFLVTGKTAWYGGDWEVCPWFCWERELMWMVNGWWRQRQDTSW